MEAPNFPEILGLEVGPGQFDVSADVTDHGRRVVAQAVHQPPGGINLELELMTGYVEPLAGIKAVGILGYGRIDRRRDLRRHVLIVKGVQMVVMAAPVLLALPKQVDDEAPGAVLALEVFSFHDEPRKRKTHLPRLSVWRMGLDKVSMSMIKNP